MGNTLFYKVMVDTEVDTLLPTNKYYNEPPYDSSYYHKFSKKMIYVSKILSNAIHNHNKNAVTNLMKTHASYLAKIFCCYVPIFHLIEANYIEQAIQLIDLFERRDIINLCVPRFHGAFCGSSSNSSVCSHIGDQSQTTCPAYNLNKTIFPSREQAAKCYMFDLQKYILDHNLTTLAEALIKKIIKTPGYKLKSTPLLQVCEACNPKLFVTFIGYLTTGNPNGGYLLNNHRFIKLEILRKYPELFTILHKNGFFSDLTNKLCLFRQLQNCWKEDLPMFNFIMAQLIEIESFDFFISDAFIVSKLVQNSDWATQITNACITRKNFNTTWYENLCKFDEDLAIQYLKVHTNSITILHSPCLHKSLKVFHYIRQSIAITPSMIDHSNNNQNCLTLCAKNQMIDEFKLLIGIYYNLHNETVKRFSSCGRLILELATQNNLNCLRVLLQLWTLEQVFLCELAQDYTQEITLLAQPYIAVTNSTADTIENAHPEGSCEAQLQPVIARLHSDIPGGI
jgi:hypothetical protein